MGPKPGAWTEVGAIGYTARDDLCYGSVTGTGTDAGGRGSMGDGDPLWLNCTRRLQALLRSMGISNPGIRDNVISNETLRKLDELRGFRHVVRHAYEYQLNAERVKTLVAELPALGALLERDLDRFADEIRRRIAGLETGGSGSQDG